MRIRILSILLLLALGCSQGAPGSPDSSTDESEATAPGIDVQIPEIGGESAIQAPAVEEQPAPTPTPSPTSAPDTSASVNQLPSLAITFDGKSVASGTSVSLPPGGVNESLIIQASDPEDAVDKVEITSTDPVIPKNQILLAPIGENKYLIVVSDKIAVEKATITVAVTDRPVKGSTPQQSKSSFSAVFTKAIAETKPPVPSPIPQPQPTPAPAPPPSPPPPVSNPGKALKFDGYNDHVVVAHTPRLSPSEAITVMAWVKKDKKDKPTDADRTTFLRKGTEYTLDTSDRGDQLRFTVNAQWNLGKVAYPNDGEWHHVAGTYDKTTKTIKTYVDGEQPKDKNGKVIESAYDGYINPPPTTSQTPVNNLWPGSGDFESGTENFGVYDPNGSYSTTQEDAKFGKHSLLLSTGNARNGGGVYGATVASTPTLTVGETYTISLWAKSITNSGYVHLSFQGGNGDENCLSFEFTPTTAWRQYSRSCTLNIHKPSMFIWGGPSQQWLIDGLSITEGNTPPPAPTGTAVPASLPLRIGAREDLLAQFMKGLIDEVCIYNRALTADEIKTVRKSACTENMEGIVGYWPLDEGEGSKAADFSNLDKNYNEQIALLKNDLVGAKRIDNPTDKNAGKIYKTGDEVLQGLKENDEQTAGPVWTEGVLAENSKLLSKQKASPAKGSEIEISPDEAGLLALYHMNDDGWKDATGKNNGTATGAVFADSAKVGSHAGSFDGTDDYLDCGILGGLSNNSPFTYSAWIKFSVSQSSKTIMGKHTDRGGGASMGIDDREPNKIKFHLNNYGSQRVNSTKTFNDDAWHNVAGTWDGEALKLYVDGVLDASAAVPKALTFPDVPFNIGRWVGGSSQYFNGLIDEVAIYNRALTADEIARHAGLDSASSPTPPPPNNLWTGGGDFESGTEGFSSYPNGSFAVAQGDAKFGTHSLSINFTGQRNAGGVYGATMASMPALTASKAYTISLWAKTISNTGNVHVSVGGGSDASCLSFDFTPTATWQQYSKSCTIDAHKPYMYFWGTPDHQFLIDGFSIVADEGILK